ncbi:hypothetical protein RHS04_04953 [Rhizoctonia solani]|uniref:Uncharacterized protein n=1 Tax=Rhizoctonia solani TaxID=456999 RepID=A0A8H7LJM4_9AGAM|nr:hypothetical protein RHS04_04953 [Rhizoctonia solani]
MAPIVSTKILSEIMMNGCTEELSKASRVKGIYADLRARPVAICKPIVVIVGSVIPRLRRAADPYANGASYKSLPSATFTLDSSDFYIDATPASEDVLLMANSEMPSVPSGDSDDESSNQLERVTFNSKSTNPLEACPEACPVVCPVACSETKSTITCMSESPSNMLPTPSMVSNTVPPSTAATSVRPWGSSKHLGDPLQKFGTPPSADYTRSCSPVDSLDIIRYRRASEAVGASPPSKFAHRVRKYSDVSGLKGLRLRGLDIFKRIKW